MKVDKKNSELINFDRFSDEQLAHIYTRQFLEEFYDAFKRDSKRNIKKLEDSIQHRDIHAFRDALHALKGSAGNINAKRLYELCQFGESIGESHGFEQDARMNLTVITECLAETQKVFEAYLASVNSV